MRPLNHLMTVCALLAGLVTTGAHAAANAIDELLGQDAQEQVLEPDQAFQLAVQARDAVTLQADFTIAPGHYLYRDRITFKARDGSDRIREVILPPGEAKHDENFGDTVVFHRNFSATIKLAQAASPAASSLSLQATYQGCSEKGLCYSPIRKTLDVALPSVTGGDAAEVPSSESDQVRTLLQGGKLWLIALGFFGFGLLLSLTPCVFPMIPILSGIIVGQGNHPGRLHSFNLSLAYTLGMALAYTLAGIAAGLSGQLLSNTLQNAWALGFSALVFVVLALSMFGLFELKLPAALENRLVSTSNRFKGGRFAGVFAMGVLSALIVSPCVAAPLAGALLYIGQTHDVVLGGVALFALSIGMGVPLLVLGASAGAVLPKAGAWMKNVQNFFGVVMLAMAIWLIGPVIPLQLQMALFALLLIVTAIFMHALDSLPANTGGWNRLWKGLGIAGLIFGIALLLGALSGSRQPLQPLAGIGLTAAAQAPKLPFQRVASVNQLDSALQDARGKFVMLDFYADWCVSCKEYEAFTFTDPRVGKLLQNVVLLKADVTQNGADDLALLQRFGLFGPPGILFFDRQGQEIRQIRTIGYQNAQQFLVTLNSLHASQGGECPASVAC